MTESERRITTKHEVDNIYENSLETEMNVGEKANFILQHERKGSDIKHAALIIKTKELIKQNPPRATRPTSLWHLTSNND